VLDNIQRQRYRAAEFAFRRKFLSKYQWFASYTRSEARANAVIDYSVENPILAPQAGGPLHGTRPIGSLLDLGADREELVSPASATDYRRDRRATAAGTSEPGFRSARRMNRGTSSGRRTPGVFPTSPRQTSRWNGDFRSVAISGLARRPGKRVEPGKSERREQRRRFTSISDVPAGAGRAVDVRLRFLGRK